MTTFSERFPFASWPNPHVPGVAAGVYVVWDQERLIYCGMSGRSFDPAVHGSRRRFGLATRLNSHASGRLSGDQFCVYVANRMVIPALKPEDLARFEAGALTLDQLTRAYVRERFEYQFATVASSEEAYALEHDCRSGKVFGVKPLLNPE